MGKIGTKLLSIVCAVALALGVCVVPAYAANGSITITNPTPGETYTVYKVLDVAYTNPDGTNSTAGTGQAGNWADDYEDGKYAYTIPTAWAPFITSADVMGKYVRYISDSKVKPDTYVEWIDGANAAEFAQAAKKYAIENNISNNGSGTAGAKVKDDENGKPVAAALTIGGLAYGYYVVGTSVGSVCAIDTTRANAEVTEKNEVPGVEKTVQKADLAINDIANYTVTIDVKTARGIALMDKMSEGLTFLPDTVKVEYKGNLESIANLNALLAADYAAVAEADRTVVLDSTATEEATFVLSIPDVMTTAKANDTIDVTYSAKVNEKAVIGVAGNPNKAFLKYGNNTKTVPTEKSTENVYVWAMKIYKFTNETVGGIDKDADGRTPLANAEFKLAKTNGADADAIKLVQVDGLIYRFASDAEVAAQGTEGAPTLVETITTDATGYLYIQGLGTETYYLHEVTAPDGFNKIHDPLAVTATKVELDANNADNLLAQIPAALVENKSGTLLPSTGGMGTTVLYIIGGALVAIAAGAFIIRRRMAAK